MYVVRLFSHTSTKWGFSLFAFQWHLNDTMQSFVGIFWNGALSLCVDQKSEAPFCFALKCGQGSIETTDCTLTWRKASCYSAVSFSHVCITSFMYLVGGMQLKIKTAVNPVILAMCCLMCASVSIVSTYMEAISVRASSYQSDNWFCTKMHVACSWGNFSLLEWNEIQETLQNHIGAT